MRALLCLVLMAGCGSRALSVRGDAGRDGSSVPALGSGDAATDASSRDVISGPSDAAVVDAAAGSSSRDASAGSSDAATADSNAPDAASPADGGSGAPSGFGPLLPATHLLAVSSRELFELDRDGVVLAKRPIPEVSDPNFSFFGVFGAATTGRQLVHLAVRFLTSQMVVSGGVLTLDLTAGTHDLESADGYQIGGLEGAFGVTTSDGFVFAASGGMVGVFRFDLVNGTYATLDEPNANRFTLNVSRGLDGKLYLLDTDLLVAGFNPMNLVISRRVTLAYGPGPSGNPIRGFAVDADGRIFAAAEQGQMLRFDATGQLEQSVKVPKVYWLHDVDFDADRVLYGGDSGEIVFTDRTFSTMRLVQLPTTDNVEIVVLP